MKKLSNFLKCITNFLYPSDLYESLRPLVLMLLISGIPPYELNPAKKNLSTCVIIGRLIGILYLAMFIVSFALTINDATTVKSFFLAVGLPELVDVVMMTSTLFAMVLVYLSGFVKKYNFGDVVDILATVDSRLAKIGVNLNHSKNVLNFMKIVALTVLLYVIYICGRSYRILNALYHQASPSTWISYFIPHYIIAQILVKYLTTTNIIQHRFATLNSVSCYDLQLSSM